MPNIYEANKQLVDKKFKEIVGPIAEKNEFKFENYTYYREKNGILQLFVLDSSCVGWFDVCFFVAPTSFGLTDSGSWNGMPSFYTNIYNLNPVCDGWYYHETKEIISQMGEIKEILEEKLIPFFDSLTDERSLLSFYMDPANFDDDIVINLNLKLEDYKEAEKTIRESIETTISDLYNDIHELSKDPYKHGGKSYLNSFNMLTNKALMLKNLEEENYDYFREMIKENERITAEFLSHPNFDKL